MLSSYSEPATRGSFKGELRKKNYLLERAIPLLIKLQAAWWQPATAF